MTRIAFAADLHVDTYGGRIDPASGLNARLVDYLAAVSRMAREAEARGCVALVIAGDFTERRHPAPWLVSLIRGALDAAPDLLHVYLRGNHDGELAGGSIVSVLDDGRAHDPGVDFGRLGVSRPQLVPVARDVVLACIPYLDRHWLRAQPGMERVPDAEVYAALAEQFLLLARGLYAEARATHPDAAVVLVCHQTLAGAQMSETQQAFLGDLGLVIDARALAAIGYLAVIAGHLHRHQVVLSEPCPVVYPGSIERVDFGEEAETKGFIVADIAPGCVDWEFVPLPARPFATLTAPRPDDAFNVADKVVRCVDVDPDVDTAELRRVLEVAGAFEITEIRRRPVPAPESGGGLSEAMGPSDALAAYFADEPDEEALVSLGREILEEAVR